MRRTLLSSLSATMVIAISSLSYADNEKITYTAISLTEHCNMHSGKLNNQGMVAGSFYGDGDYGITFDGEKCVRTPVFPGYALYNPGHQSTRANLGINNQGGFVGYAWKCFGDPDTPEAGCYSAPIIGNLFTNTMTEVATDPRKAGGLTYALNDRGLAVGYFTNTRDDFGGGLPFVSAGGVASQLSLGGMNFGYARDINNRNQVIGKIGDYMPFQLPDGGTVWVGTDLPTLWQDGAIKTFETLPAPGQLATAEMIEVNDFGLAVGASYERSPVNGGIVSVKPVTWQLNGSSSAPTQLLRTHRKGEPVPSDGMALTVNNCGVIGGQLGVNGAVLWTPDGTSQPIDVNYKGRSIPRYASQVMSINDRGQLLVGTMWDGLFLLTPDRPSDCHGSDLSLAAGSPTGAKIAAAKKGRHNAKRHKHHNKSKHNAARKAARHSKSG